MPAGVVTAQAHYLQIKVQSLPAGRLYLGIYQQTIYGWYTNYTWPLRITGPGLYGVDLADASMYWSITSQFQIMIFIEGNTPSELGNAVIDSVSITNSLPPTMTPTASSTVTGTRTPTVTATITKTATRSATPSVSPTPTISATGTVTSTITATSTLTPVPAPLNETFNYSDDVPPSSPGLLPAGWTDASVDSTCNAYLKYAATDGLAEMSVVPGGVGMQKVLSPYQAVNLTQNHQVEVTVNSLPGGVARFGVYSREGGWSEALLSSHIVSPGTYTVDVSDVGWSGIKNMGVELYISGGNTSTVAAIFDTARIRSGSPALTGWVDDFLGTAGSTPREWRDATTDTGFGATLVNTGGQAVLTRTNSNTWGKALSPVWENCNVSTYPLVEVSVTSVTASAAWKLGMLDLSNYQFYDLTGSLSTTGVYQINYANATGWSGLHNFLVQLVVEGAVGQSVQVDWVRIGQAGSVHGAGAGIYHHHSPTRTPTATCTPTPISTSMAGAAFTATSTQVIHTPTPTSTPIPWAAAGSVAAYPNPAHGRVLFAYTVAGSAKVDIDIFRLTGERVAHIEERKDGGSGQTFTTAWEAAGVAPGVYFCRIVATDAAGKEVFNVKKKMALVR